MATSDSPDVQRDQQVMPFQPVYRTSGWAPRLAAPRETVTYEQFLNWADEDTLAEWVDGVVVMTSPASLRHQLIASFLTELLGTYARLHELGRVISAPFQMKLANAGREPDVLFIASAHLDRLKQTYLDGPADLVIEILSPESAGRDRGDKFYEYEQAGIPEYWLIDPLTNRAEFYVRDAQGLYAAQLLDQDGRYSSSALPNFWLHVAWLWQDQLPNVEDALLEIDGASYAQRLIEQLQMRGFLSTTSDGAGNEDGTPRSED